MAVKGVNAADRQPQRAPRQSPRLALYSEPTIPTMQRRRPQSPPGVGNSGHSGSVLPLPDEAALIESHRSGARHANIHLQERPTRHGALSCSIVGKILLRRNHDVQTA